MPCDDFLLVEKFNMATNVTLQERTNILKLVAGMFNAVPGATYLEEFSTAFLAVGNDYGSLAAALGQTTAFKSLYPSSLTVEETANKFLGTLGLANNAEAQDYVQSKLNAGEGIASVIFQALAEVVEYAGDNAELLAAQTQLANKAAVAEYYSVTLGASSDSLATLQGVVANVTADPASVEAAKEASQSGNGKTFMLTKGLDNVLGTAGNDTIIGSVEAPAVNAELNTLSALDIINGGAGVDTLKIATNLATAVPLANVSNVEIVEVQGAIGVTVDTSTLTGVTNLNVTKAAGVIAATAGATTDVSVALKSAGAAVGVVGGKNVAVKLSDVAAAADVVTIGAGTAPKGDVVVEMTGKAYTTASATTTLSAVTVNGGKTVSVTQKAAADTAAAAADLTNAGNKVVQGAVTVNANADTTAVTVKQDATVAAKDAANTTGGVTETATVKFGALKNGDVLAANGLTFTAKADMTGAEVASAFANLVTGLANANTDTQGSGLASKGTYTNQFNTAAATDGWTAAAASGDTVVFTAARANQNVATDLAFTLTNTSTNSVAPTVTTVQGQIHNATPAGGVMGVDAGAVTVGGGAAATAVKTITVDGYAAAGSSITATTSALEALNLSNGGAFAVTQAAATLALNLTNVGTALKAETLTSATVGAVPAVLDLNNTATKTLNVKSNGVNTVDLQLDGATGTTTLNVSGTGLLNSGSGTQASALTTIKVTETAGLTLNSQATALVTSVDTTGTTGAVTLTLDGSKATYAGGAGVDKVTITNANTAIAKAIDLGAGDDTLTLNVVGATTVAVPTVDLKGGDGVDTIALSAADAVALSANGTFAGKIDGFEKLSVGNATTAGTVNLANLDNINYVISANSGTVGAAATKEVITIDFATSGAIKGADTVLFDGQTTTLASDMTQAQIALAFAGKAYGAWDVTSVAGSVVTLTAKAAGDLADVSTGSFTITDVDTTTAAGVVSITKQGLDGTDAETFTIDFGTSGAIEDADTIAFNGTTITLATGDNAAAIAGKVAGGVYANWTTSVAGNVVTFTNKAQLTATPDVTIGDFTITNVKSATPELKLVPTVTSQGAAPSAGVAALTIDKMASGGTLELTAAGAGAIVKVTDAGKGTVDVLNVVTKAAGALGTVTAADVETINLNIADADTGFTPAAPAYNDANGVAVKTANVSNSTLTLVGSTQTKTVTVEGAGNLGLTVAANTKLTTVDASKATGALTLSLSGHDAAVTVTGGSGNDVLSASTGANGRADVLVGGAGNDTLNAGSNGAKLTGGEGNDLFVLTAGTKEVNTYTSILDFQAGDVLELNVIGGGNVTAFAKLTAVLNEDTSVFSNFADAAIAQAAVGEAVWFQFKGNAYVVVDNTTNSVVFENNVDAVIQLVGVDLANASYNSTHGTIALV